MDFDIQKQRQVINIPNTKLKSFLPGDGIESVDLHPTGDAGPDFMAALLFEGCTARDIASEAA